LVIDEPNVTQGTRPKADDSVYHNSCLGIDIKIQEIEKVCLGDMWFVCFLRFLLPLGAA
jgi:hypothetical protein